MLDYVIFFIADQPVCEQAEGKGPFFSHTFLAFLHSP